MIDLSRRSYQKELMDRDDIPFADMAQTLKELNVVNTRLGGHSITIEAVKKFIDLGSSTNQVIKICEIGCGGGDNLNAIYRYFKRRNIPVNFIGIDLNKECIEFAKRQYAELPCEWICSNYKMVKMVSNKPDIIFSSLFCHHFNDEELVSMMKWQKENSLSGFFINDLHRHWLAYYLIKYITKYFSRSYLVKNDACISVARSFRKNEWQSFFQRSGISNYSIHWRWAFRYLVVSKNRSN